MKKLILFAAILFAGVSVAKGQVVKTVTTSRNHLTETQVTNGKDYSSATTNLKVTLNSILSISVNTSAIHLEYKTVEDYKEGVQTDFINGHVSIYSTGGYDVSVKYDNPMLDNSVGNTKTAAEMFNSIQVGVQGKGYTALARQTKSIITSKTGGMNVMFNVNYKGQGTDQYIDFIQNGKTRVLSADVIYEITAS